MTYSLSGYGRLAETVRWAGRVGYDWNQSIFDFWSYQRVFADVGLPVTVQVPWFGGTRGWIVTPYIGGSIVEFNSPNPTYDPNVTRHDREWHVGATIDAELATNLALRVNVNYQKYESNIANFAFNNFAVSAGPAARF